MMSAGTDFGVGPLKKRATTTYGKNRSRNLLSATPEASAPLQPRAPYALQQPGSKPKPKEDDALVWAVPTDEPGEKQKERRLTKKIDTSVPGKPSVSRLGASSAKQTDISSFLNGRPALKRKPTQQPTARQPKKQRSSSPDSLPAPKEAVHERSSTSQPIATKDVGVASTGKRPARPNPPHTSTAGSLSAVMVAQKTMRQSIPIRPPRKLKPHPKAALHGTSSLAEESAAPSGTKELHSKARLVRRSNSPEKRPEMPSIKESISSRTEVSATMGSPSERKPQALSIKRAISTIEPNASKTPPIKRRPRLIDTLAAQAERSSSPSSSSSSDGEAEVKEAGDTRSSQVDEILKTVGRTSPAPTLAPNETPRPRTFTRQVSVGRKPGLKYTYSQQRTMLADDTLLGALDSDRADEIAFSQPLLETPSLSKHDSVFDFDDGLVEDASTSGAVRSIHELRKAGANNRSSDEMNDILDRIGAPGTTSASGRRNALLETAQKAQQKTFRRQFSNHHDVMSSLLRKVGSESDPVAGYLIVAILVTLMGTGTSSHLTRQLPLAELGQLMAFLLPISTDISALAKDRKSNMSKFAQSTLTGVKTSLLQLKIWEPATLVQLSPRTLVLKCLHLIIQQSTSISDLDDLFLNEVNDKLFHVLASAAEDRNSQCWDFPSRPESVDLFLALSLLAAHSISAMQSEAGALWNTKHLPVVASILETSLTHRAEQLGELEILVLKLTLNTANNNQTAHSLFLEKGLLRDLARAASGTFDSVSQSIANDAFLPTALDSLVLVLGVMINFSEHDESAGRTLDGFEPLDRLISFFLRYSSRTAEADSEAKSRLNVALGYLSVLLGYLCQYRPIRKKFQTHSAGGSLRPLVDSMREFMVLHEAADSASGEESDPGSFSNRLRAFVDELESAC